MLYLCEIASRTAGFATSAAIFLLNGFAVKQFKYNKTSSSYEDGISDEFLCHVESF